MTLLAGQKNVSEVLSIGEKVTGDAHITGWLREARRYCRMFPCCAILAVVVFCQPTIAAANNWEIQYLAYTGGMHATQVERDQRQFTEAYIRHPDRMGLYVGCLLRTAPYGTQTQTMLRLANGHPFLGPKAMLSARFDDTPPQDLEEFSYSQGGSHGFLPPHILAKMMMNNSVEIKDSLSGFTATFSLDAASDSISKVECLDYRAPSTGTTK